MHNNLRAPLLLLMCFVMQFFKVHKQACEWWQLLWPTNLESRFLGLNIGHNALSHLHSEAYERKRYNIQIVTVIQFVKNWEKLFKKTGKSSCDGMRWDFNIMFVFYNLNDQSRWSSQPVFDNMKGQACWSIIWTGKYNNSERLGRSNRSDLI